jgi:hypothetical protein
MTLGKGRNSSAPFPYVATTALPNLTNFEYNGIVIPIIETFNASSTPVDHPTTDLSNGSLVHNAGRLPISDVLTASSAFGGAASVLGFAVNKVLADFNHAGLTPWVSSAQGGTSFRSAAQLIAQMKTPFGVSKRLIRAAASEAVHGVIDGGYSEGTGLGHAVASGATEVVVVLNSNCKSNGLSFFLEVLCKNGPPPIDTLKPKELYPLFETRASTLKKHFAAFKQLNIPNGTKFLDKLVVGTTQLITTDNPYFGLTRGRRITVHIIGVTSCLHIGFFDEYVNFAYLTQDIATAILDVSNTKFVQNTLLPMLEGRRVQDEAVASMVV